VRFCRERGGKMVEAQIMSCIQHPQHRPPPLQPHNTHDCRHLARSPVSSPQLIMWLYRFIRISRSTQLILLLIMGDFRPIHVRIEMQAPVKTRTSISSSHLLLQADTSTFPGVWELSLGSAILPKIGMLSRVLRDRKHHFRLGMIIFQS
jgi:hypothetical protein